jgi:hypothetical protein
MWTREKHALLRSCVLTVCADPVRFGPASVSAHGALGEALDEIERLSRYIENEWAREGITPDPKMPLSYGLFEVKNGKG